MNYMANRAYRPKYDLFSFKTGRHSAALSYSEDSAHGISYQSWVSWLICAVSGWWLWD